MNLDLKEMRELAMWTFRGGDSRCKGPGVISRISKKANMAEAERKREGE